MTQVTSTDRTKQVPNRCVIEVFDDIFDFHFLIVWDFLLVIGLRQISSFFC